MTLEYNLTSKQVSEQLGISTHEVNKLAQNGHLTRQRKNPENNKSPWLYSEQELNNVLVVAEPAPVIKEADLIAPLPETEPVKPWYYLLMFWKDWI